LKFTEKGSVTITAENTNTHFKFSISDTGHGMTEETKNNLFEWGSNKTSKVGTNNEKGTGLGLSIIKEFTDQLGADIHVDTEINKGTTITISIPLQKNL
jgi:signal transduction histidine kinase